MKDRQLKLGLSAAAGTPDTKADAVADIAKRKGTFKKITIAWPADLSISAPRGKWTRLVDGRILATYTPEELAKCLEVLEAINMPDAE